MDDKINQLIQLLNKIEELFQTFAWVNILSFQLYKKKNNDMLNSHDKIYKGTFIDIRDWWRVNVHKFGAKFFSQEIIHKITASEIDPNPYINYNYQKYSGIYD
ncbi:MAG TPA: hypothetical protein VK856_12395 [Anaerolineaceae bacterium]|nr:hypothetical protein [Anaerolineaceae bacterium]